MTLRLFKGSGRIELLDLDKALPAVDRAPQEDPANYVADEALGDAVTVSVSLGMPLLLTGEPGTGKTQLAYRVAAEYGLGKPLVFETKSSSVAQDLFYQFDTVWRFSEAQAMAKDATAEERARALAPQRFVRYQALGLAILRSRARADVAGWLPPSSAAWEPARSVVLIDEIDKAPRDFPNDLLNEIARRSFHVPEISEDRIEAAPRRLPIVIITSNSEKQLPDAFLRRCVYHHIEPPTPAQMRTILAARLPRFADAGELGRDSPLVRDAVGFFHHLRINCPELGKQPSTAELLNWVEAMLADGVGPDDSLWSAPAARASARRALHTLAKSESDLRKTRTELDSFGRPAAS